jgi:hypothetical protein
MQNSHMDTKLKVNMATDTVTDMTHRFGYGQGHENTIY